MSKRETLTRALRLALGTLLVAVATVVCSALYVARVLESAALDIATNAAPSIVALEGASAELRALQGMARTSGGDPRARRRDIEEARRRMGDDIQHYLTLPAFPGERELWPELDAAQRDAGAVLDRILDRETGATTATEGDQLDRDLLAAITRLDRALRRSIEFNAQNAGRLSSEVMDLRQRALPVALMLNLVGVVAAAVVLVAYRIGEESRRRERREHDALEQRVGELDAFSGRIAHDLLNPLMSVGLSLQLLERKLPAFQRELGAAELRRAERGVRGARQLVEGLLEFARASARPTTEACAGVGEVIDDVVASSAPLAEQVGAVVVVDPVPSVAVGSTRGVLFSLISNLVNNALRALGDRDVRRVTLRVSHEAETVHIEVEDTGPGVDPSIQDTLFEPFVQGKGVGQGTLGLGLATVKRLAEAHGGRVGVRSESGAGATFWFDLPARPAAAPAAVAVEAPPARVQLVSRSAP